MCWRAARCPCERRSTTRATSPTGWPQRTSAGSCTATSSPPTCSSTPMAGSRSSTSAWRGSPSRSVPTSPRPWHHRRRPGWSSARSATCRPSRCAGSRSITGPTSSHSVPSCTEMVSGRRAFTGATAADSMSAILTSDPPALVLDGQPASPALERIIRRCLEKSPAQRFQSTRDLGFALEALGSTSSSGVAPAAAHFAPGRIGLLPVAVLSLVAGVALTLGAHRVFAPGAASAKAAAGAGGQVHHPFTPGYGGRTLSRWHGGRLERGRFVGEASTNCGCGVSHRLRHSRLRAPQAWRTCSGAKTAGGCSSFATTPCCRSNPSPGCRPPCGKSTRE